MKKMYRFLLLILIIPMLIFADANKKGSVSVLLFSNGKPLVSNEIKFDGNKVYKTDKDGALQIILPIGKHQIEIFGKNETGVYLGYFKKPIMIKEGRDTQIIATLSLKGADSIDIDTPVDMKKVKAVQVTVSKGTGKLSGTVLSSEGNQTIAGARIFVRGTSVDARTDSNGHFLVNVPSGQALSISVVHTGYSSQTLSGIYAKANTTSSKTIMLTPASMELEEFVVLAPKVEGSIEDVLMEEKKATAITNIIGSEEISQKGDGSAASALKRVTGVTLIGGKSIFVRGLGERYSNVELNSMPLASPDPTKRVVPLDIFPSSMIGSMKVQKSATADIPSSFGGGYVDIRTKDLHEEDYIKASLGLEANSNTGRDVISHEGSTTDFLGFDNGYRDIPDSILSQASVTEGERIGLFSTSQFSPEELMAITRDFVSRNYAISKASLPLSWGASVEGIKNFHIDEENKISVFASYQYTQKHTYREETFFKYSYNSNQEKIQKPTSEGTKLKANSKYSHALMLNVNYNFSDVLKIKYTKLFTHVGEKNTRITEGVFGSNDDHLIYHFLDWEERTLNVDQLTGEFDYMLFDKKNSVDFGLEYVGAILNQPNNLFYADKILDNGNKVINSTSTNFLSRKLDSVDDVFALYVKNKVNYNLFSDEDYMELGLNYSHKMRESKYQKFYLKNSGASVDQLSIPGGDIEGVLDQYVRSDVSYDARAFLISALFKPADYFDAVIGEAGMYVNMFAKPTDMIDVMMGLRYVNLTQTISQYKEDNSRVIIKEDEFLEVNDIYPSLSAKYKYDDNNHFDIALSRTYIIPDLREFSSAIYFHPYDVAVVKGNPELVNTDIYSLDFKYSHYFSNSEYIKAGLFYKYLDKPIEDTQLESSSLPIYSYINSDFATLYGIEFDGRKSLDFAHEYLKPYFISGNISYTNSDVSLTEEQIAILTSNHRQLQGLSQIVINGSLGYETEDRIVTLSYNKMGERIRKVGLINSLGVHYEDSVEVPPHLLDFVWIENFSNNIELKMKFGNILDDSTVWKQGESVTREFKIGRTIGFKVSKKF